MTRLQKAVTVVLLTAALGTALYQLRQAANARAETQKLQAGQAVLESTIAELRRELSDATNRLTGIANTLAKAGRNERELLALRGEVSRLRRESEELAKFTSSLTDSPVDKSWLDRVGRLRQRLAQTPGAQIPEMKFLTEADWLDAATGTLDTDEDYLSAFSRLRASGENRFLHIAETALQKYLQSHEDKFPTELSQLLPYFEIPPADDILSRYQIVPSSGAAPAGGPTETNWLITLKIPDSEAIQAVGKNGFAGSSAEDAQEMSILASAMKAAFDAAPLINGKKSIKLEDLAPYLTTPEQTAAYQKMMQRRDATSRK